VTREEIRQAITGPAAVCGAKIEPALVNRLLNDFYFARIDTSIAPNQRMRSGDQLSLLQSALRRTWQRCTRQSTDQPVVLRLTEYEAAGGLRESIDHHAEEVFASLGRNLRIEIAVQKIFRALTSDPTVAKAVRRPLPFGELVALCDEDPAIAHQIVDRFRDPDCGFLTPALDQEPLLQADTIIDFNHERLIRQWRRLSGWVRAEADDAQRWRQLTHLAEMFQRGETSLLFGQALNVNLAWRDHSRPSAVWARRYGGDYSLVMGFLERSRLQRLRDKILVVIAAMLAPVILAAAMWGLLAIHLGGAQQ
jgi:hypothetical protein